jgi:hypothetical protein
VTDEVSSAIERGDLDELIRLIDALCTNREWKVLVSLRDRAMAAAERGKQLWPAAHHAEYRLALEAPGEWAGPMLVDGSGAFALGPVSEVAASTHSWSELAPHVTPGPVAALAAHERVVRGEDLSDTAIAPAVLDLPLRLMSWEPEYAVAAYRAHTAEFPTPLLPVLSPASLPASATRIDDRPACRALTELAAAWTQGSDGRAEAVAVQGGPLDAIAALGARRARVATVDGNAALAHMAWTAASGGAYGRRRGAAIGRFDSWLAVAAMARIEEWPLPPDAIAAAVDRFEWMLWDAGEPATGWSLRLAAGDPETGAAWAMSAADAR